MIPVVYFIYDCNYILSGSTKLGGFSTGRQRGVCVQVHMAYSQYPEIENIHAALWQRDHHIIFSNDYIAYP